MKIVQKTTLSKTSVAATAFVFVLMVAISLFTYHRDRLAPSIPIIVMAVLALISLAALLFMPVRVRLDDEALTVIFPCRAKSFAVCSIAEAAPFADAGKMWRICGSGAFFGWWGWFSAKGVGRFMMYAANLDHLLLIRLTNGKKYVISCGDPAVIARNISRMTKR